MEGGKALYQTIMADCGGEILFFILYPAKSGEILAKQLPPLQGEGKGRGHCLPKLYKLNLPINRKVKSEKRQLLSFDLTFDF